jgi:hypothetical protein
MQDPRSELRKIHLPRTQVNKGMKKGRSFVPRPYKSLPLASKPLYATSAPRSIALLAINGAENERGQVTCSYGVATCVFELYATVVSVFEAAIRGPAYG